MSADVDTSRKPPAGTSARKATMMVLSRATLGELSAWWTTLDPKPVFADVRPPEQGLVMVRGRIGGEGAPFNLGEATVTRSAVRLANGAVGHAYVLGRSLERARLAALADAIAQTEGAGGNVETALIGPITARLEAELAERRAKTLATRVEFFTVARGEDER